MRLTRVDRRREGAPAIAVAPRPRSVMQICARDAQLSRPARLCIWDMKTRARRLARSVRRAVLHVPRATRGPPDLTGRALRSHGRRAKRGPRQSAAAHPHGSRVPTTTVREERGHVREGWREVLRRRRPSALLGRESRELGQGAGAVREGMDRVLPRVHGSRAGRHALAPREVPEVLRGRLRPRRVRRGARRRRDPPVDVPEVVVHGRLQHDRAQREPGREVSRQADRQRPVRPPRG